MLNQLIRMAENGYLPDSIIKIGIRRLCNERLSWANKIGDEGIIKNREKWIDILEDSPIALVPDKANEQHYEVPSSFFENVLGENLKYSSGYWPKNDMTLNESELIVITLLMTVPFLLGSLSL